MAVTAAAATIVWAAGVQASPAARWIETEADRAGRVIVEADLTVPGFPEIFVIGDTAAGGTGWRHGPRHCPGRETAGCCGVHPPAGRRKIKCGSLPLSPSGSLATIGKRLAIIDFGWIRLRGALPGGGASPTSTFLSGFAIA
jgi:NADH dehydrogenase